jgi:hypothetical protein
MNHYVSLQPVRHAVPEASGQQVLQLAPQPQTLLQL